MEDRVLVLIDGKRHPASCLTGRELRKALLLQAVQIGIERAYRGGIHVHHVAVIRQIDELHLGFDCTVMRDHAEALDCHSRSGIVTGYGQFSFFALFFYVSGESIAGLGDGFIIPGGDDDLSVDHTDGILAVGRFIHQDLAFLTACCAHEDLGGNSRLAVVLCLKLHTGGSLSSALYRLNGGGCTVGNVSGGNNYERGFSATHNGHVLNGHCLRRGRHNDGM